MSSRFVTTTTTTATSVIAATCKAAAFYDHCHMVCLLAKGLMSLAVALKLVGSNKLLNSIH